MSAAHNPTLPPLRRMSGWIPPIQVQPPAAPSVPDQGRIVFTRQLWQRTMPEDPSEQGVSTRSQPQASLSAHHANTSISRRTSSNVSTRSLRRTSSPSGGSKTPLTPEESPPFRSTRERNAGIVEQEDKEIDSNVSPVHTRVNSGDSASQVCICQPDPKIPRPRNAFILYRQHHQAKVVAQHPGLANPEISKIIGEQWQNQSIEVKNEWKALAEEEKLRHQQQYPTYRYQPKRSGGRNSISSDNLGSAHGEKPKCTKCGGRSLLASTTPYTNASNSTSPTTAGLPPGTPSLQTPVSRTLPILRDLSLQSPALRRQRHYNMSPNMYYLDERDDVGPLSPDAKRRRFNGKPPAAMQRQMPPRYAVAPQGMPVGPGTPFPFGAGPQQSHQFAPNHGGPPAHLRRDSLPGLRGMGSPPGPMPPPPRPGMGYQQHRLSTGHDRSLTLPPLQTGTATGSANGAAAKSTAGKSAEEVISGMPFSYKLNVLRKIAPPKALKKEAPRGPLIAIEGENPEAVTEMAKWLAETLGRDSELDVRLLESPDVAPKGAREDAMAEYHLLAANWLSKSKDILKDLEVITAAPPPSTYSSTMETSTTPTPTQSTTRTQSRNLDENYDDSDSASKSGTEMQVDSNPHKASEPSRPNDSMDLDPSSTAIAAPQSSAKPVTVIPLFSLHASNTFALRIPLTDPYAPSDHWQWSATQWRCVVGPDLTIYLRDGEAGVEKGKLVEQSEEEGLFVVRRTEQGGMGVDGATLRRVGFEVGEWVRAFGAGVK